MNIFSKIKVNGEMSFKDAELLTDYLKSITKVFLALNTSYSRVQIYYPSYPTTKRNRFRNSAIKYNIQTGPAEFLFNMIINLYDSKQE